MDSTVQCGIKRLPKDVVNKIGEKHNNKFNNLRNTKNMLIANNKPILSFKKMIENNNKDDDIFQLYKLE